MFVLHLPEHHYTWFSVTIGYNWLTDGFDGLKSENRKNKNTNTFASSQAVCIVFKLFVLCVKGWMTTQTMLILISAVSH